MCVVGATLGRPFTRYLQRQWTEKKSRSVNGRSVNGTGTAISSGSGELAKEDYKIGYMDSKQTQEIMSIGTNTLQDRVATSKKR